MHGPIKLLGNGWGKITFFLVITKVQFIYTRLLMIQINAYITDKHLFLSEDQTILPNSKYTDKTEMLDLKS